MVTNREGIIVFPTFRIIAEEDVKDEICSTHGRERCIKHFDLKKRTGKLSNGIVILKNPLRLGFAILTPVGI
jgi:hypothetical protein